METELTGRIDAIILPAAGAHPTFTVHVDTAGEDPVTLIFVGFRSLPGFRVGRNIAVRGRLVNGRTMYNPIYWLEAEEL